MRTSSPYRIVCEPTERSGLDRQTETWRKSIETFFSSFTVEKSKLFEESDASSSFRLPLNLSYRSLYAEFPSLNSNSAVISRLNMPLNASMHSKASLDDQTGVNRHLLQRSMRPKSNEISIIRIFKTKRMNFSRSTTD